MFPGPGYFRSAAAWQLAQFGDAATYATLAVAIGKLSPDSLATLEDELEFFTQAEFVGPRISALIAVLYTDALEIAA